jgi:hypothetical protein
MFNRSNPHHNVPAIRRLADFAARQMGQTKPVAGGSRGGWYDRDDGREDFRGPEYRLIQRG